MQNNSLPKITRGSVLTGLTILISLTWLTAFALRLFGDFPTTPGLDGAMLTIIGFWFSAKSLAGTKNGGPT